MKKRGVIFTTGLGGQDVLLTNEQRILRQYRQCAPSAPSIILTGTGVRHNQTKVTIGLFGKARSIACLGTCRHRPVVERVSEIADIQTAFNLVQNNFAAIADPAVLAVLAANTRTRPLSAYLYMEETDGRIHLSPLAENGTIKSPFPEN